MIMDESSEKCRSLSSKSPSQDNQLFPPLVILDDKVLRRVERAVDSPDGGPAAKRPRMSVTVSNHYGTTSRSVAQRLKQSSLKDLNNATANGTAKFKTPLPVCKPPPVLSPKQHNTVRIIAQYLRDLGLTESLDALTEESGCKVENAHASRLRDFIYKANWSDALAVLDKCFAYLKPQELNAAKTIILEEKFYDLLHKNDTPAALRLLREEFPTRPEVMEKRSSMIRMLFMDKQQLSKVPEANKYRSKADRKKLAVKIQRVLPAQFILPTARLEQLLDQAYSYQVSRCRVHMRNDFGDTTMEANAIFTDHSCRSPETKRYENIQTLRNHATEVWCVEFSQDGKMLASGSKTNCINVWKVDNATKLVKPYKQLGNRDAIDVLSCMSWSSDSKFLAVAGTEQMPFDILVFNVKEGCIYRTIRNLQTSLFTTCVFFNAKNHFLVAGDERGHMKVFDMDRPEEDQDVGLWEGFRIKALYGMRDGATVLAADSHHRLRKYSFDRRTDETLFTEEVPIITFRVHLSEKYILTTTQRNLRMWDLQSRTLVRNFSGAHQGNLVIHASFGGGNQGYIATGTEDHKVAIWNVDNSRPVLKLRGHKRVVNAVTWNPRNPTMLASCSEDKTVRIWSVARSGDTESSGHKVSRKQKLRRNASNREHKKNGTCK